MEWSWHHENQLILNESEQCICGQKRHRFSLEDMDEYTRLSQLYYQCREDLKHKKKFLKKKELRVLYEQRNSFRDKLELFETMRLCKFRVIPTFMDDFLGFPLNHGDIYRQECGTVYLVEQMQIERRTWTFHRLPKFPPHMVVNRREAGVLSLWNAIDIFGSNVKIGKSSAEEWERKRFKSAFQSRTFEFVLLTLLRLGFPRDMRVFIARLVFACKRVA